MVLEIFLNKINVNSYNIILKYPRCFDFNLKNYDDIRVYYINTTIWTAKVLKKLFNIYLMVNLNLVDHWMI